jgi:hypothetical protein
MAERATMRNIERTDGQPKQQSFDLIRITKSKDTVDLAPNTIRSFARQGLKLYKCGKACFFSRAELEHFIRN